MKIPRIGYEIYYSLNGTKLDNLDLKECEGNKIFISLSNKLNKQDIDKGDINSNYYKNICYKSSLNNADMTLEDKKNYFLDNNLNICEENCNFYNYEKIEHKIKCLCDVKTEMSLFSNVNINKTELIKGFTNFNNIMNLQVVKCYKIILTKSGIIKNYVFYFFVPIFIIHLISFIIFAIKGKKKLQIFINIISYRRQKLNSNSNKIIKTSKNSRIPRLNINLNNKNTFKTINIIKNQKKNIKVNKILKGKKANPLKKVNLIKTTNKFIHNYNNNSGNNKMKFKKMNNQKSNKKNKYKKPSNHFTITELNNLPYKLALKLDKRSYCIYFISLLKIKHIILFTFFLRNDFNIKIVKIDLFFFFLIFSLTINALFFNDSTMHKIYIDQGVFNLEYQIPQIAYSTLISSGLNMLIKFLALTENSIIKLKVIKIKSEKNRKEKCIFYKVFIYFIISFFLLLIFGVYLSCFCAVYEKTQIHLIKDTAISFGLNLIYPIFLCLIPGIFRRCALKKNNREFFYKFSKILQII